MTEALVALTLLVPIVLCMQAIAELQGTALQATQRARMLAMSSVLAGRTVSVPALIAQGARLFSAQPVQGGWTGSVEHAAEPVAARDSTRRLALALAPAQRIAGAALALEESGWVTASSQQRLGLPHVLRQIMGDAPFTIRSRLSLLTEDYQAVGREEVSQRLAALDAMAPMRAAVRALRPLAPFLSLLDPPYRTLCPRLPDPDILPADRLSLPVRAQAAGPCQ